MSAGADIGPTVSALADEFGLPAVDYEVAVRVRNKAEMRKTLELDYPVWLVLPYNDISPEMSWKNQCKRYGVDPYPCVIKPLEKAGSRGVSLVRNPFDWYRAEKSARNADLDCRYYLVEQYIENDFTEVATDNFVLPGGKIVYANAVKRYFSKDIFGLELGHINPFKLNTEMKRKISFAVKKLGVDFGPFKCDFIYNENYGWVIAECATRLSGGFDSILEGTKVMMANGIWKNISILITGPDFDQERTG